MSAPDDKAEGLNPLAERASGPESDYVAMKRYSVEHDAHGAYLRIFGNEVGPVRACGDSVYIASDADRVIATERRENSEAIAARDARIAQLEEREMSSADLRQRITTLTERLASRDAQLAEARELLQEAYDYGTWWRGKRIYKWVTTSSNVPAEPSGGESNG